MKLRIKNYRLAIIIFNIIRFLDRIFSFKGTSFFEMEAEEVYKESERGIQIDDYYLIIWGRGNKKVVK